MLKRRYGFSLYKTYNAYYIFILIRDLIVVMATPSRFRARKHFFLVCFVQSYTRYGMKMANLKTFPDEFF